MRAVFLIGVMGLSFGEATTGSTVEGEEVSRTAAV